MGDNTVSSATGVGGFQFGEATVGGEQDAWVTSLPADLQAAFDQLDTAPADKRAQLADKLLQDVLARFDEAAADAKLPQEQQDLWREAIEESIQGSTNLIFKNKLSAEKIRSLSIEELMFYVMSERTKQLDTQIRGFAEEIQSRNNLMEYANEMLSQARNQYAGLEDDESATMSAEMAAFFQKNGIDLPNDSTTGGVVSGVDAQTKIDESDAALASLDKVGYSDNACIKQDVPDDVMTYCAKYGIEVPKDGKSLQKKDLDELEGNIAVFKAQAQAEKDNIDAGGTGETTATAQSLTRDEWDAAIQNVKGFLEGLNNQSELDMIGYQSVMSKYTSGIEMLSNTMKKLADNKQAVVRNMT